MWATTDGEAACRLLSRGSGLGGLNLGVQAALARVRGRVVPLADVEREASAAAVLAARLR